MTAPSAPAVRHTTGEFAAAGGLRLFRQSWLPEGPARAAIAVVHGYAEHSGRYEWAATRLAQAGYAVHAYDLRGHGRSDGPRVLVKSFNQHSADLERFLGLVGEEQGAEPLLFGHSMGGGVAAFHLVRRRPSVRGVILSGPAVMAPGGAMRVLAPFFMLVGRLRPATGVRSLAAATVSRDPAVVAAYDSDPLVYRGKMPAGTLRAAIRATRAIKKGARRIQAPLLLLHGSADELVPVEASRWLNRAAGSKDKTLKVYGGLAHEVLNEPEKEQVMTDLLDWLQSH